MTGISHGRPRYTCPHCGRRTVIAALRPNGEDHYRCTYLGKRPNRSDHCGWWVWSEPENGEEREQLRQFRIANGRDDL